jgi:hypothetical protein
MMLFGKKKKLDEIKKKKGHLEKAASSDPKPFEYMNVVPGYDGRVTHTPDLWIYTYTFNVYIPRPEVCVLLNESVI